MNTPTPEPQARTGGRRRSILPAVTVALVVAALAGAGVLLRSVVQPRRPTRHIPATVCVPAAAGPVSPQTAAAQLRAVADRVQAGPAEKQTGRYTYHHLRRWIMSSPTSTSPVTGLTGVNEGRPGVGGP